MIMADDPERDFYPTKEVKNPSIASDIHASERLVSFEKRSVPHLSRSDLEDQFYNFKEENYQLKKAAKKQEENLKKLATKMSRLLREKKSMESMNSPSHKRDLELEEMVEDLQDKVRQLEKTNSHLREKMLVAKQQVIMQVRRPYSHIAPKVNSGNAVRTVLPYTSSVNVRGKAIQNYSRKAGTTQIPPYAVTLLEEARNELSNLKMLISSQKNEIEQYEHENEILKQKLRMREIEFEDELNLLKSQLTQRQRQHVQENLDLIRLHRELKQKNSNYHALQTQCSDMEEKMRILKLKHDHLVKEMDDLASRFKSEQKKNLELLGELQKAQMSLTAVPELQERISVLQKENTFLRETNEKFIKNALDIEKERVVSMEDAKRYQMEEMLKQKIVNLETSLEVRNKEKYATEEELAKEKRINTAKEEAYIQLKGNFERIQSQMVELEAKVDIIKSLNIEFHDLEEAVTLLKLKRDNKLDLITEKPKVIKETEQPKVIEETEQPKVIEETEQPKVIGETKQETPKPKVVEPVKNTEPPAPVISVEELENLNALLKKNEQEHGKTIKELSNVRELLMTQYDVNKSAQQEIKILTEKLEQQEKEFELKLQEYMNILDLRNARIQKLEKQLNDIAYGTQTFQAAIPDNDGKHIQTIELSKGENIFEIHIVKIDLTSEGLKKFHSPSPNIFLTWNFYEFELQSSPVVLAKSPIFNFTAQYTVQVDDYFLCYLSDKTVTLELHESFGVNFKTFAACQLDFSEILTKSCNRIHGTQQLIGISEETGINFGTVEFWIRLQIPMEEAFKFFKEKLKALKYIHSNKEKSAAAASLFDQPISREAFINDLHIKILRGINLKSRQKDVQPTTFCVYKFFDLPDQDTPIIPASNNPEYSDHRTFSIFVNASVEKYLKTEDLYVYVFDDNELDITSHIGRAAIPLHNLLQNKPIKGTFELEKNGRSGFGSIEVLIYWQYEYVPISNDISSLHEIFKPQKQMPVVSSSSNSSPASSEDETTADHPPSVDVSFMQPPVPKPRKSIPSQPVTSTPRRKESSSSSSEHESGSVTKSPKFSPIKRRDGSFSVLKESAKQSSRSSGAGKELKVSAEIHSSVDGLDPNNKPHPSLNRKESLSTDTSDEDKPAFSEDSDESDNEMDNQTSEKLEYNMTVSVHHLMLRSDAAVLQDATVKMLYVEYRFLDYPLEELETPFSLPKVASPNLIQYNFEKEFSFKSNDVEKWSLLAKMILSDTEESSLIKFTVVSEPPSDEQDLDCEEIGYGSVDLKEILSDQADKIQEDITIYDAHDSDTEIGILNISVQALNVLVKLKSTLES